MSRSSPGVRRVAAILNFIADHPGQAFALTDLVRALKLSRATCHALLTGLVDVGYLYRTSDKTYVLGPALAAIGRVAAEHFSPLQVAQPEMRSIADEFDVVCGAYFLEGDTMHLRDRAASVSHVGYPVPLGTRMKLHWTQAIPFFARSPKEAEAWLERTEPRPNAEQEELFRRGLEFVREHGFIVHIRKPGFNMSYDDPQQDRFIPPEGDDVPVSPQLELKPDSLYPLAAIMAPIFDSKGRAPFSFVMAGFRSALTGDEAMFAGNRLKQACDRISAFVSGRTAEMA
ncbi:MAG: helix-turn-helix domain-containing protein [Novosphingobium sp.]|nr:helix-turn-helix domain-containing protein [Novosphingobium sp.]MCP5401275.1 helix-turn-helix domain-containing protein [Novosphingobium sp.]